MNRNAGKLIIIVCLFFLLGCSAGTTSDEPCCVSDESASPTGSIYLSANEYSKSAAQGELVIYPMTVKHDIQGNSTVEVIVSPSSGNKWKFSLCYNKTQCFISEGSESIQKSINLLPDTTMELEIQIFIPEKATTGDSSTVEINIISSKMPKLKSTSNFTATVR
jgi:hypothetical protein